MEKCNKTLKEYKCFDNPFYFSLYGLLIFMVLVFICSTIAVIVSLINGLAFIPDGLGFLMGFSFPSFVIIIPLLVKLPGNKQGIFTINKNYCTYKSKLKGESIYVKLNTDNILRIEIKDFSETRRAVSIVLVDELGKYGNTMFTGNGEYIKLRYSKKRLEMIKRFLPNCSVIYSNFNSD